MANSAEIEKFTKQLDSPLEPLIAPYVKTLQDNGVETFESCQGGEEHSYVNPTIAFHGDASAGWKALSVALTHNLPVSKLQREWSIYQDQAPDGSIWKMVFTYPAS